MKSLQRINDDLEILFLSPSEYKSLVFADTGQPLIELFPEGMMIKIDRKTGEVLEIGEQAIAEAPCMIPILSS